MNLDETTSPALAALRLQAEDAGRREDWPALIALRERLVREDPEFWPHLWQPALALAVQLSGGDGVLDLDAAVEAGFRQPELLPLAQAFGADPRWPGLLERMSAPPPPPRWLLRRWPTVQYGPPLVLDTIAPQRLDMLRERLPAASTSAWDTARNLLHWSTTRWSHANDHVAGGDALDVLEAVDGGARFACVEFSIVLSQALNAVGLPARRVSLRRRNSHVGIGRSHVVSEAWIDDLGRWVLLDGQNGAWWGVEDDPQGLPELLARFSAGEARPPMTTLVRPMDGTDQDDWWDYFDTAVSSGLAWSASFSPIFQGRADALRLLADPGAATHPDLSRLETSVQVIGGVPAVSFRPAHPYALGVDVGGRQVNLDEAIPLDELAPDRDATLAVSTRTAYGTLTGHDLSL